MTTERLQTLTYKYCLRPTARQHAYLEEMLEGQRILYNAALESRIDCYKKTGVTRTFFDQCKELTELRQEPEFSAIPSFVQRWTIKKLHEAYESFFSRLKSTGKAGFPRYRGKGRWQSFGFQQWKGIRLEASRIRFKGLPGSLRIHLHRPLPEGKPLGCTFTRDTKGWYVCLLVPVTGHRLPANGRPVGVDVGLTTLAMLSTGEAIANPRHTKRWERELRRRQRALSRCKRGSNRRKKVKARVTRLHTKITNSRRTYLHQVSARLVREFDLIAVEKLNVKGLAFGMLAKSVRDAGWSTLRNYLAYKAEWAGREFVEVDCRFTSQICPECGAVAKKELSERTHRCDCGCVLDRDHAAALVILQRGGSASRASQLKAVA